MCPPRDVQGILGGDGSAVRAQLHDQTLVDFALIVSYVGLWGATGLALNPGVAVIAVMAGIADVVENLAILHELALPDPVRFVRWAALAKWSLLGLVFIAFLFLSRRIAYPAVGRRSCAWRPGSRTAWRAWSRSVGLVDVRYLEWVGYPVVAAVCLQLVLHLTAHRKLEAARYLRLAARASAAPSLSLERVLSEEYESLHGPLGRPAQEAGGLAALYEAIHNLGEKRAALCFRVEASAARRSGWASCRVSRGSKSFPSFTTSRPSRAAAISGAG